MGLPITQFSSKPSESEIISRGVRFDYVLNNAQYTCYIGVLGTQYVEAGILLYSNNSNRVYYLVDKTATGTLTHYCYDVRLGVGVETYNSNMSAYSEADNCKYREIYQYSPISNTDIPKYGTLSTLVTDFRATKAISYSATNGTISGPSSAIYEDVVTLTVTPDTGYVLSSIAVYKTASQDPITYTKVSDTTYTFVMPDVDVTVTGIFVRAYTISYGVNPSTAGTISGSLSQAQPGQTVTFTVAPDSNFQVSSVSVNAGITNVVWSSTTLTGSFVMPERNTYVTVTLVTKDDPNEQGGTSEPEIPSGTFDDD